MKKLSMQAEFHNFIDFGGLPLDSGRIQVHKEKHNTTAFQNKFLPSHKKTLHEKISQAMYEKIPVNCLMS